VVAFLLVMAQVLLFGHITILNIAFCFAYITVILSAPVKNSMIGNLILAFIMGIVVDSFNHTLGINAFAALTLAYFRLNLFGFITYQSPDEQLETDYTMKGLGTYSFIFYVILGSLLYTSVYYFLASWGWMYFWQNCIKIVSSTLLTTIVILCVNILFFRKEQSL
jgi:hypothetical protein